MNLKDNTSSIVVTASVANQLAQMDAIIFDCDGVLVDNT